jgi:hypothetical protein
MAGIKESKEAVVCIVTLLSGVADAAKDGKIGIGDLISLVGAFQSVPAALDGLAAVPAELKDLDEAEKQVLFAEIAKLHLPSEAVEMYAERILKAALVLGGLVSDYLAVKIAPARIG